MSFTIGLRMVTSISTVVKTPLFLCGLIILSGCDRNGPPVQMEAANCQNLANETYSEALAEAIADPTVWRFAGNTNAQDYANMRKRLMLSICGWLLNRKAKIGPFSNARLCKIQ
jgi:hypothetical protein